MDVVQEAAVRSQVIELERQGRRLGTWADVVAKTRTSKVTLLKYIENRKFPAPIRDELAQNKLGFHWVRFDLDEVDEWIEAKFQAREAARA